MTSANQTDLTPQPTGTVAGDAGSAMKAAKPPVGTGSAPLVGQLVAVIVLALGVVGVQEALVRSGLLASTSWTGSVVDAFDGLRVASWMVVVGVLLILAGLFLLPVVVKRRPRKSVSLAASTGVYVRTRDLARLCEHAVDGTDGVTDVHVKAAARKVRVTAVTVAPKGRNRAIADDVRSRLATTLDALERSPRVKVSIKNEGLG